MLTMIHWWDPEFLPRDFSLRSHGNLPLRIVTTDGSIFAVVPAPPRGWTEETLIDVSVRHSKALADVEADCYLGDIAVGIVEHWAY